MIRILICGDYCPYGRVLNLVEAEKYDEVFGQVLNYTSQADYSIVNLESPVVESEARPIKKCGPNLLCSSKAVKALKYAGFNMTTLANNHFYDYGNEGVKDTLNACKEQNIDVVGGGINIEEASQILYKEIKGVKFAFINCCEREFSIATECSGGSNPLNPVRQYYDIKDAKENADKVIVIVHGGHEHYNLPSPRMKETYRFFIDAGADAVINHHQHCYSGYELYRERPICYGLGNFCFDWENKRKMLWNEGYMIELLFEDEKLEINTIPYVQGDSNPGVEIINDTSVFNDNISSLNALISDDVLLKNEFEMYLTKGKRFFDFCLEPYRSGLLSKLFHRGLMPPLFSAAKIPLIENMVVCESHKDRFMYYLKTRREND